MNRNIISPKKIKRINSFFFFRTAVPKCPFLGGYIENAHTVLKILTFQLTTEFLYQNFFNENYIFFTEVSELS